MIAIVAVIKIKPGMEEKVIFACHKMAEAVLENEKNCLMYELFMPTNGASEVFIIEKYTDEAAVEEHRNTEHYKAYREAIKDAVTEPPQVSLLKSLS